MSDLVLWFRTPSPLQSSWGCVCRALSHWCTQHTPNRGKAKITQKTLHQRLIPSKSPSLIFSLAVRKTFRPEGFHLKLFSKPHDRCAFILHRVMQVEVCVCVCVCVSRESVSAWICVTSLLWCPWCCVGWVRGDLPWTRRGRRRSGRCTSMGSFVQAKGHRRTDRWAGRWSSARPVRNTHTHTLKTAWGVRNYR